MKHLMVFISPDNDIYFTKPMSSIVPLGTLCFINLRYMELSPKQFSIDMSIESFRYQYDIDSDTLEIHFREQPGSEMSDKEWEELDNLVHRKNYHSSKLIVTTSMVLAYIKH